MQDRISFACRACRWDSADDKPELHAPAWAQLSGYGDCVRWLAGAPTAAAQARLLEHPPACGEVHWLSVRLPFSAHANAPFWCLYQPPFSSCNGWAEHPEELSGSAIVCCTLMNVADVRPDGADVLVTVRNVWAIDRISSLLEPKHRIGADLWQRFATQTMRAARWRDFTYIFGSLEGDVATMALFEKRDGRQHLLLEGYSSHHVDFVFAGNSPLDAEGESGLQGMLTKAEARCRIPAACLHDRERIESGDHH